jgi:hypothetical protein
VALVLDLAMDDDSWREMAVTEGIELDLDTLAGGGAVTAELDLERGRGVRVEVESDLNTEIGASSMVLGLSDTVRAAEEAEAVERAVAAELAREIEGEAGVSWLLEIEGILTTDGDRRLDEIESILDTDGGTSRTVAEELERDTVRAASRALVEEFALDTGDDGPLTL